MVKKGKRKFPRKTAYKENPSQQRKTLQEQQPSSDQNKPVTFQRISLVARNPIF